jgi:antirestriction protein ArdC
MNGQMKINEMVTQRMIERITELGELPWRKPWASASQWPRNLITKKRYRGINVFMLHSLGYTNPYFLTLKQANELGGKVRKGERAIPVVFWKILEPQDSAAPKDDPRSRRHALLRYYQVFNVDQTIGVPEEKVPKVEITERKVTPIEEAEKLMHGMPNPPVIKYGLSQAAYLPSLDIVQMPKQAWFCEDQHFYATMFHELAHSTGHENRLARKGITAPCAFGADPYAKEELVAEMASVFLCNHCGILPYIEANSASYLGGWLKRLHEDHSLIISAGSQAQRAFDYIVGPVDEEDQETASEQTEVAVSRSREPIHQKGGI